MMSMPTEESTHSDYGREYIRHPTTIPLSYRLLDTPEEHYDMASNVSQGGVCFHSEQPLTLGQWLHLYIDVHSQVFSSDAQVKWCRASNEHHGFDVGVAFANESTAFNARMVEQVCYIEQYKQFVLQERGQQLTMDQAASEWIDQYAGQFPQNTS